MGWTFDEIETAMHDRDEHCFCKRTLENTNEHVRELRRQLTLSESHCTALERTVEKLQAELDHTRKERDYS
jgi:polyhydroxyalkanoate synthesis regulator phasin